MRKRLIFILFFVVWFGPILDARADTLGQSQKFYIDSSYDYRQRQQINATLRLTANHAYAFVEDSYWDSISRSAQNQLASQIQLLMNEFDNRIYPMETNFFGAEPNPGIDDDSKITILFAPLVESAGGYFNTANLYPYSIQQNPTSNQREMFYINISSLNDFSKSKTFLAHEFQHLISFNQKERLRDVSEDTWLNELRSEYAPTLLGYNDIYSSSNLEQRLASFLSNPSDSLTEWKNLPSDYSQIALFGEYLTEHWSPQVLVSSLQETPIGIPSINQTLKQFGYSDIFPDIFRDWLVADYLNDIKIDSRFGYTREGLKNFHVVPNKTVTYLGDDMAVPVSDNYKDWQGHWYEFSQFAPGQKKYLQIKFSSTSLTSFQVPYLIMKTDGSYDLKIFEPSFNADTLIINADLTQVNKIVLMPYKRDRLSGFGSSEPSINLTFVVDRFTSEVALALSQPSSPRPADYGLHEGDFIRAEGDNDVYIVNDFGYKRLILNPEICLQYGHLGARGCFSAVKMVSPAVRDLFVTSWYFTNGETKDGKIYLLKPTGEDTATLTLANPDKNSFTSQGNDYNSVFLINTKEQNSY